MRVQYIGKSFGVDSLTDGKIYDCLAVEYGLLRIVDDSREDYLYSAKKPGPLNGTEVNGRWRIIEDDADKTLASVIPD